MLKVTAWLAEPLAEYPPMLDAILEGQMASRMGLAHKVRRDLPAPPEGAIHIPLAHNRVGGRSVPCCSSPIFAQQAIWREHLAKRFSVEHAHLLSPRERTVIATGNATLKSYRLPLTIRAVERVVWFCKGHRRPILQLLRSVPSLGKKRSVGYGRVRKWEAEEVEGRAWWYADSPAGVVLMRPLPDCDDLPANLIGFRRDFGACTPPYWHPDRYAEIVVPC